MGMHCTANGALTRECEQPQRAVTARRVCQLEMARQASTQNIRQQ